MFSSTEGPHALDHLTHYYWSREACSEAEGNSATALEDDGVIWQDDQGRGRGRKKKRGSIPLDVVHGLTDGPLETYVS